MALSIDTSDKIAVNGVDLLNRHELSPYQDKELQRFIDENRDILSWKDRDKFEATQRPISTGSNYSSLSKDLNRGASPLGGYHSMERKRSTEPVYTEIGKNNVKFIPPNINGHNFTTDFPGMEQLSDNSIFLQLGGGRIPTNVTSRPASAQGSYAQSGYGDSSRYSTLGKGSNGTHYGTESAHNYDTSTYGSDYRSYGAATDPYAYSTASLGRGGLARPSSVAASPYGTLKSRKGVSWLDQERARSLSPTHNKSQPPPLMSQYGSAGNLGTLRDQTASPAYSALGKHSDNYNRFETQRHAAARQDRKSPFDDSRFGGFGDRPGSGVELTQHQWSGGEIVTDPNSVPKGMRTRRLFYSPIGDGTVAADGYELKRRPVDLSPRVTITQLQHVDRGAKGKDGVNIYEKSWTNTMGSAPSEAGYAGSDYGPGSGRNSRAGALSPATGLGGPGGAGAGSGAGGPGAGGPSNGLAKDIGPARGAGDPFGSGLGPNVGLGGDPFGSNGNIGPPKDGRTSVASSMFSDPSYRLVDTKTGYLITNPRELIHQYATTTPVATMDVVDNTPSTTTITKQSMYRRKEETTEEHFSPYAPYKSHIPVQPPNKFVRQLRDDTMTNTQREANTHMDPMNQRDPQSQQRIHQIQTKSYTSTTRSGQDDIDNLTQQLVSGLHSTTPVRNRFA